MVHLISDVDMKLAVAVGPYEHDRLPGFDYVIRLRRRGGSAAPVELTCNATPPKDASLFLWHQGFLGDSNQYADWREELDDCPFDFAPGAWEIDVVRRWRTLRRDGDVVHRSKLRIEATRW